MNITEALQLILDLASENTLDRTVACTPELVEEMQRQNQAHRMVEALLVNSCLDELVRGEEFQSTMRESDAL